MKFLWMKIIIIFFIKTNNKGIKNCFLISWNLIISFWHIILEEQSTSYKFLAINPDIYCKSLFESVEMYSVYVLWLGIHFFSFDIKSKKYPVFNFTLLSILNCLSNLREYVKSKISVNILVFSFAKIEKKTK